MGETKFNPDHQMSSSLMFALLRCRRLDSNLAFSLFSNQAALAFVATGSDPEIATYIYNTEAKAGSFQTTASEVFKDIGLTLPFTADGDLTGIVKSPEGDSLRVSSIYHRSVVEVSEEGTEAAATTAAVVEVEEETEAATVTAALAVEVVEGTKVANATAAVAVEDAEEETETRTVVLMEDDEEGTEAAAPTSVVSMDDDEEGTESAASLEDDKEGTEADASTSDVSVEDGEEGAESATFTSSDWMEDNEEGTSDAVILKVDRPFAFVIKEEGLGGVLFAGYLLNPLTAICNI